MTENQKKQIIEMRKKGIGYKAISTSLGLSRDIVRTFCKARNMTGFGMAAVLNVDERISTGEICPNCCKSVRQSAKGRRKKFCSEKCRREWWKAHPENADGMVLRQGKYRLVHVVALTVETVFRPVLHTVLSEGVVGLSAVHKRVEEVLHVPEGHPYCGVLGEGRH